MKIGKFRWHSRSAFLVRLKRVKVAVNAAFLEDEMKKKDS